MIHIIVVEDNELILREIVLFLEEMFLKTTYKYQIHAFLEYGNEYEELLQQKLENKIFIFDIEIADKKDGLEAAEELRKNDINSPLIFLTVHENYGNRIIKSKLDCFRIISKQDDYLSILDESIEYLLVKKERGEALVLKDNQHLFVIPFYDILYFTTDTSMRKSVVVTENHQLYSSIPLKQLETYLPRYFIRTQRACIVNIHKVLVYDYKERKMLFKNGQKGGLLSKTYQELINERLKELIGAPNLETDKKEEKVCSKNKCLV